MNQQEIFLRVNMIEQETGKLQEQIDLIEQQISELNSLKSSIETLDENKQKKEVLTNLGKGIFIKTEIKEKDLFVNVGKETIIKKTPQETIGIINGQLKKLDMGKENFLEKIENLQEQMQKLLDDVEKEKEIHKKISPSYS